MQNTVVAIVGDTLGRTVIIGNATLPDANSQGPRCVSTRQYGSYNCGRSDDHFVTQPSVASQSASL